MVDLHQYTELIQTLVAEANEGDPNWKWSVKSVGKTKARIFWSYLEYCGQPEPYFVIELEDTGDGYWIHALDERDSYIESEIVVDNDLPFLNTPLAEAIKKMIRCIVRTAHSCY